MTKNPSSRYPTPEKSPRWKDKLDQLFSLHEERFPGPLPGSLPLGYCSHTFTNSVPIGGTKVLCVLLNSVFALWPLLRSWHQGGRHRVLRNPPALHLALHNHTRPRAPADLLTQETAQNQGRLKKETEGRAQKQGGPPRKLSTGRPEVKWSAVKWSEVAQSCPTLCDPMDCSLPGSSVHGIFPGKNTGVGWHFLLRRIYPTQGLNPGLPHCRQTLYCLSHQGSLGRLEAGTNPTGEEVSRSGFGPGGLHQTLE